MKRFLLKKTFVLGMMLLLAAGVTAANLFPAAGIFSSGWFILVCVLFLASLMLSTIDQYRATRSRMRMAPGAGMAGETLAAPVDLFAAFLKEEGYRELARSDNGVRFGKGVSGYWAGFILHLGMVVTVLFALLYVLTESRTIVRTIAGMKIEAGKQERPERTGLLAAMMPLPAALVLENVQPSYWENDQLKTLSSDIVFLDEHGGGRRLRVGISDKAAYRGIIVYQQASFGVAFFLELADGTRTMRLPLLMPMPQKRGSAAYGDADLEGGRYKLKAKYLADINGKDLLPRNPLLSLRLYEKDNLVGENSLMMNGFGQLGPFRVSLVQISWWTDILLDGSRGIAGIFSGFFLLLVGGCLGYFVAPREVLLSKAGDGYTVAWRTSKFADFYREEGDRIMAYGRGPHA